MEKRLFVLIISILALVFIYHPITTIGFARVDDGWMLLNDKMTRPVSIDLKYIFELLQTFNSLQYSPLNTLIYALIYRINGYDPYWYHIFCLTVHAINGIVIYKLSVFLLKHFSIERKRDIALIVTFVWLIHPLNVESVVWISASKIPLFSLFFLCSILCFFQYYIYKNPIKYILSIFFFLLSGFCKEQTVILPLVLSSFILLSNQSKDKIDWKKCLIPVVPFLLIAMGFGIIALIAQRSAIGADAPMSNYSIFERIMFSFYCAFFYIYSTILPIDLHYHYKYPIKPGGDFSWNFYIFPIAFLTLVVIGVKYFKVTAYKTFYWFCISFIIFNLMLCIQIFPLRRPAVMADRYMYLPSLGFLLLFFTMVLKNISKVSNHSIWIRILIYTLIITYLLILIFYSNKLVVNWNRYNIK